MKVRLNLEKEKVFRVLEIYTKLLKGELIKKSEEAQYYGVHERSIQRDIDDIRAYLKHDQKVCDSVIRYIKSEKGYRLVEAQTCLSNEEILAVCKILLSSRALVKDELEIVLDKLIQRCDTTDSQLMMNDLIANEKYHYKQPKHKTDYLSKIDDMAQAIESRHIVQIEYEVDKDKKWIKHWIKPVSILFSEYYFYITAFKEDKKRNRTLEMINADVPMLYRIDKIRKLKILNKQFYLSYKNRYIEEIFKEKLLKDYTSKSKWITFQCTEADIEAVLKRLPTAKIISTKDEIYEIKVEIIGKGIDTWLNDQWTSYMTKH